MDSDGMMKAEEIAGLIQSRFGDAVVEAKLDVVEPWVQVKTDQIQEVARFLRDEPTLKFDFLRSLSGVDYPPEIEVVYHLFSYTHRHEFKLKVRVSREQPGVASLHSIWPAADWHERETYDLLGVIFEGHPDLRRILLPDDWVGHPLRKDFKEAESYHGVSTRREYLTGMPELPTHPGGKV